MPIEYNTMCTLLIFNSKEILRAVVKNHIPTLYHHSVHDSGTARRRWESVSTVNLFYCLVDTNKQYFKRMMHAAFTYAS